MFMIYIGTVVRVNINFGLAVFMIDIHLYIISNFELDPVRNGVNYLKQ